jgi:hypothetical protein
MAIGLAAPAVAQADKVLLYGPSTYGGETSLEATRAKALGYEVVVADAATWSAMTAQEFASYNALIFGDNNDSQNPSYYDAAVANRDVWGPVVNANILAFGADAELHWGQAVTGYGTQQKIENFADSALRFVAGTPGRTGAYVNFIPYGHNHGARDSVPPGAPEVAEILKPFGNFRIAENDSDQVHIEPGGAPNKPNLLGLTDYDLSNWSNTAHGYAWDYPSNFRVWGVAAPGSTCDGNCLPQPRYQTADGFRGLPVFLTSERIPPTSSAVATGCGGVVTFSNNDNDNGSGSKAVHFRVDGGPEQSANTSGNPPRVTVTLPTGAHNVEYWGVDVFGNAEPTHHNIAVVSDAAAPVVTIKSDQNKTKYNAGSTATITTTATDAFSKLTSDPSKAKEPLNVLHAGLFEVSKTAVDACGNAGSAAFAYTVLPVDSTLRLRPSKFAAAATGGAIARASATAVGSRVSYRASDAGNTTFEVLKGKSVLGSFSRADQAGRNSFRFTGRLNGAPLDPGKYRLRARPTAGGLTGPTTSRAFEILP